MTLPKRVELPPPQRTERVIGNVVEITDVTYAYRPVEPAEPDPPAEKPADPPNVILRETWANPRRLIDVSEEAPDPNGFVWARANSIAGKQGLPNSDEVGSDIIDHDGRKVLRLWIRPTATPKSYGARVVLTVGKRWEALKPYAGKRLRFTYDLCWPTLPAIHPTAGTWATVGSQMKDIEAQGAIAQVNMNRKYEPWLGSRSNKPGNLAALPYVAGQWHTHDLDVLMRADASGQALLDVDGQVVGSAQGPQAQGSGYSTWQLCLYGDFFAGAAELLIGDVTVSVVE